jgi:hypothetical protein
MKESVMQLELTQQEADELEQLLLDVLYPNPDSHHLMFDSRTLFDILTKLEERSNVLNSQNVQES